MDYTDRLRLLALNDERLADGPVDPSGRRCSELDPKTLALVRLAALVAVGGALPSYGAQADAAVNAGASAGRDRRVLIGVAPVVGLPDRRRRGTRTWRWRSATTPTTPWSSEAEPSA